MSEDNAELEGIAVIGMAGRFPGAADVVEFWENIRDGKEGISFFSPEQLDPAIPEQLRGQENYVLAKGVIEDADKFDAAFFGVSPVEAQVMDPQQRIMLELAWAALEDAGYVPDAYDGLIGVYAGTNWIRYYTRNVLPNEELRSRYGEFNLSLANEQDFVATRTAYKLDLRGPSVSIQTACSTGLVAIGEACEALLGFDCDIAIAGGISVQVPLNAGYLYEEGGMLSADGHCRTFDKDGTGTTFNDGAALVVLKRLEEAIADRDQIYAVIRGYGLNNDGADKVSFTAPSVNGQAAAIRMALEQADIDPRTIGYVETHGTATPLGDPIEVAALTKAFRVTTVGEPFCAIGSVKSNVGHLIHAAGAAGLIKAALCVRDGVLTPSLHFQQPNPKLGLAGSPFYVNTQHKAWPGQSYPRRAGVSSFGVGGTNAHVVIEQPPQLEPSSKLSTPGIVSLSAKTPESLENMAGALAQRFQAYPHLDLHDATHTLQTRRASFPHRLAVVGQDLEQAAKKLQEKGSWIAGESRMPAKLAFAFTGQGSQCPQMGFRLYESNEVYRQAIDECAAVVRDITNWDLHDLLFTSAADSKTAPINQTEYAQPGLFATEYALARTLMAMGLQPEALLGHSVGEYVAAAISGVMSLQDAVRLVVKRGACMQAQDAGSMLAVFVSEDEARRYLTDRLSLAAVNAPELCVISGSNEDIEGLQQRLESEAIRTRRLVTSHAFHSWMMDPALEPFAEEVENIQLHPPEIEVISTATGRPLGNDALSPQYWTRHLRETVRFCDALSCLAEDGNYCVVEVGPGTTLTVLVSQHSENEKIHPVSALPGGGIGDDAETELYEAIAKVWVSGGSVNWSKLYGDSTRNHVSLPTYKFARKRYWVDPPSLASNLTKIASHLNSEKNSDAATDHEDKKVTVDMSNNSRLPALIDKIKNVFADTSGMQASEIDSQSGFVDQGFDSLFLTQAATAIKKAFSVKITFRQLMEDYPNVQRLAEFLDQKLPQEPAAAGTVQAAALVTQATASVLTEPAQAESAAAMTLPPMQPTGGLNQSAAERLLHRQLDIMQQQLAMLGVGNVGNVGNLATASAATVAAASEQVQPPGTVAEPQAETTVAKAKQIGPATRISKQIDSLTPAQAANLQDFVRRYNAKTKGSKEFTQRYRARLADPRTASGFRPIFKEMIYQIVIERSKGSRIWDIDGNEYIDLLCGFGSNMFGHVPDYIQKAIHEQVEIGMEIGPQTALAAEVGEMFCEMTGKDRVCFANTGSEAVAGAMRLARTVTGRPLIVTFEGDYHGIYDEVLFRGSPNLRTFPAAPGVNPEAVQNMLVLPYADTEALNAIRERGDDVAGILIEYVQGRNSGTQPVEFLQNLRNIADDIGCALISDEVITGFRVHQRGAQGYFNIKADLATYGKVVGGGMPIGLIAGTTEYMDALDGGQWQFGDNSVPEVGVTYFAGTFVRHPLVLAAARAALIYMNEKGPALQENLNRMADDFVKEINSYLSRVDAPYSLSNFGSLMNLNCSWHSSFNELLYYLLRDRGIHIWPSRPCFLTTEHSQSDLKQVVEAFQSAIEEMGDMGFLELKQPPSQKKIPSQSKAPVIARKPPVDGAKLGRDRDGNPSWFIPDPDRPGKYLQLGVQ
jgi:acyl transferase domain-containing protein